jgi:pyruvate dehydrogenase E1 component alpha subunit
MAELLGKVTGTKEGGSMHIFKRTPFLWWSRNVGDRSSRSRISFADKYFETGVTMTYFGDGAARQGSLHEASTWQCCGNYQ